MSFITDHCARIDAQLDRLQLSSASLPTAQISSLSSEDYDEENDDTASTQDTISELSPRLLGLQAAIRTLSTGAAHRSATLPRRKAMRQDPLWVLLP
jgi:hypothetical protein